MTRQSTLPSIREQAHHALLLLGVPTPARLLVDVHAALLDGDLSVSALVALLRDEERAFVAGPPAGPDGSATALTGDSAGGQGGTVGRPYPGYVICPGLTADLTAARGILTVSTWALADRIGTPAVARAEALAATVRIAELVAMRPGACATWLLRRLAANVPGGPESLDVLNPAAFADVARTALEDPALAAAVAAEQPIRDAAVLRAAELDERQRLFGVPVVPQQRGGA
jgi:hypothetical protein